MLNGLPDHMRPIRVSSSGLSGLVMNTRKPVNRSQLLIHHKGMLILTSFPSSLLDLNPAFKPPNVLLAVDVRREHVPILLSRADHVEALELEG